MYHVISDTKVCQWLATGRWFFAGNIVESVKHHNPNPISDHIVALISLVVCTNVRAFCGFPKRISEASFIYLSNIIKNLNIDII